MVGPHRLGTDVLANMGGVDPREGASAVRVDSVVPDVCIHLQAVEDQLDFEYQSACRLHMIIGGSLIDKQDKCQQSLSLYF